MKRLLSLLLAATCITSVLFAQEEVKSYNAERIALKAVITNDDIPAAAYRQLLSKLTQIAAKNGCAATANSPYTLTCSVDELSKDITATMPPMHAYTLAVTLVVGNSEEGRQYASTTVEIKGAGQTPEKAYISAIKTIRVSAPAIKAMITKGKEEISTAEAGDNSQERPTSTEEPVRDDPMQELQM